MSSNSLCTELQVGLGLGYGYEHICLCYIKNVSFTHWLHPKYAYIAYEEMHLKKCKKCMNAEMHLITH